MPESKSQMHFNPHGFPPRIYGRRLVAGDVVEETDVYASTSGTWEQAPCPGLRLPEGSDVIWVRPEADPWAG